MTSLLCEVIDLLESCLKCDDVFDFRDVHKNIPCLSEEEVDKKLMMLCFTDWIKLVNIDDKGEYQYRMIDREGTVKLLKIYR